MAAEKRRQLKSDEQLEPITYDDIDKMLEDANAQIDRIKKIADEKKKEFKAIDDEISMEELEEMCEPKPEEKMEENTMKTTDSNVTVKGVTNDMNELVNWAMKKVVSTEMLLDMSEEDMICMKKVMKIFNDTLELANKYRDYCYNLEAKVDRLESKLDKVLEKLDEK